MKRLQNLHSFERVRPRLRGRPIRLVVIALIAGVGLGVGIALVARHSRAAATAPAASPSDLRLPAQASWPSGAKRAHEFQLRDQNQQLVSLHSQRGRPVLLTFLDSRCRQECPIEGKLLGATWRRHAGASHPALLVVSVNPWQDTPASARLFMAKKIGWGGSWHWLFGSARTLGRVWRAYDIDVKRNSGNIGHGAALYLIDGRGFLRRGYLVPFTPVTVVSDLRRIKSG